MQLHYLGTEYSELSVAGRCNALREARDYADEQESTPTVNRDWMIPFNRDDPRFEAFVSRSNELRALRGKPPVQIIEWRTNRGTPIGIVAPESRL